ncbi:MAG TPA: hypothetical protein VGH73_15005 [Thermoanaerobaculia bacterium]|jgi:hypothetical protein
MDEIRSLTVQQVRIYAPGIVPLLALRSAPGIAILRKKFGFQEMAINPTAGDVTFVSGLVVPENGDLVAINFLEIGAQKTAWEILGSSSTANALNDLFVKLITELSPEMEHAEPLLFTQVTQCTVRLAISWKELISEKLASAIEEVRHRFDLPVASTRVAGMNLNFTIQYDVSDLRIKEWGIGVLDKNVTLNPVPSVPFSERLFNTSSPLDSDAHLQLVQDLETALAENQGRRATVRRR